MRVAIVLTSCLTFSLPAAAQTFDIAHTRRIDSVFSAYTSSTPGCALAVTNGGNIAYARGYGMASLELQVPITPQTVFDLGSVSKQFTAASIFLLQLDGKLSIDDDVRRYLPELPALGAKVTLRHLLNHTSGWRDYNDLLLLDGWDERDHTTDRDAWDSIKRQRALNFVPGSTYRYSNTGYFLLGEVVRRVSGVSLAKFADTRVFQPLGMSHTQYLDDTRRVVANRATAYAPDGAGFVVEMSNWDQLGDGAVQSNVEDLAKWQNNFTNAKVGGPQLIALLTTHGRLNNGEQIAYSAGLALTTYRGVEIVWHTGAWAGYRASVQRIPAKNISVILTCNRADASTLNLALATVDAVLDTPPVRLNNPPGRLPKAGTYVSSTTGSAITLSTQGDTLRLGTVRLHTSLAGTYLNPRETTQLVVAGQRIVYVGYGGVADTMDAVEAVKSVPRARLADYVGRYSSGEIAMAYNVIARGDSLFLRKSHGEDIVMTPTYTDAFTAGDLTPMRFVRNAKGDVTALSFTGPGMHDLRLAREK